MTRGKEESRGKRESRGMEESREKRGGRGKREGRGKRGGRGKVESREKRGSRGSMTPGPAEPAVYSREEDSILIMWDKTCFTPGLQE
jgi:hypothetical protein